MRAFRTDCLQEITSWGTTSDLHTYFSINLSFCSVNRGGAEDSGSSHPSTSDQRAREGRQLGYTRPGVPSRAASASRVPFVLRQQSQHFICRNKAQWRDVHRWRCEYGVNKDGGWTCKHSRIDQLCWGADWQLLSRKASILRWSWHIRCVHTTTHGVENCQNRHWVTALVELAEVTLPLYIHQLLLHFLTWSALPLSA